MNSDLNCEVYKSSREEGLYLYVRQGKDMADIPEVLLKKFGKLTRVISLTLSPGRRLARCTAEQVIESIDQQGFYLQLPPSEFNQDCKA